MINEDVNENINPLIGTNNAIAHLLSINYGEQIAEDLQTILSNADLVRDIELLRDKFGIIPKNNLNDNMVDQYIADAICIKENIISASSSIQDIRIFINILSKFTSVLTRILEKYNLNDRWRWPLSVYVAKGNISALDYTNNIICVSMDKATKAITIRIQPTSRTKEDLNIVAGAIYSSWDKLRNKPKKRQRNNYATRDSKIASYKATHSYSETAAYFNLDIDSTKKIVRRQRAKREKIN